MTTTSLYNAVLTLVRQLPPEDQRRLAAEVAQPLNADTEALPEVTAETVITTPEIRAMVAKMRPEEMMRPPKGTPEDAIALLRSWNEEDAQCDDDEGEPWDEVLRSIDANRSSYRRLFPDLDPQ